MSSEGAPPSSTADRAEGPALPRRLLDTFFSPGKMAEAVALDPRWLGALLVSMALIALSSALLPPELFAEMQRRAALERGVAPPPMTEDTLRFIRIFAVAGGAVGFGLFSFIFSGLYALVFAFILGDEGRYRQYLALFAHAAFIPTLLSLPLVPLRISTGDPQFTLNLGSFLVLLEPGYVASVFRFLDLTQLWSTAVVALGVHAIDKRRGFGSAFTILLCFSVAIALILAAFVPA